MIRIIGGKYNSRVIETPDEKTVPTKARVREAMGNALKDEIEGGIILDLFAGSGALGINALSLGAKKAYFVDSSISAIECIRNNLKTLSIGKEAEVYLMDGLAALDRFSGMKFSLIYIDPPYAEGSLYLDSISRIHELGLLDENGAIMVEYEGEVPGAFAPFKRQKTYNYGRSKVLLLRY